MRLIAFPQLDKLTSLLRGMARQSAADYTQRKILRIIPKNGVAHLANYAANLLAVEGGTTTVVMPDIVPGKARDFMLRVTASGENELLFTGAKAFEGELATSIFDGGGSGFERGFNIVRTHVEDPTDFAVALVKCLGANKTALRQNSKRSVANLKALGGESQSAP